MLRRRLFFIGIILGCALLYALIRIRVIEMGYEVSALKSKVAEIKRENGLLKSQVAAASATSRLSAWTKVLGLKPPDAGRILYLEEKP